MEDKKKETIKVRDLKPSKDAKGGGAHSVQGAHGTTGAHGTQGTTGQK